MGALTQVHSRGEALTVVICKVGPLTMKGETPAGSGGPQALESWLLAPEVSHLLPLGCWEDKGNEALKENKHQVWNSHTGCENPVWKPQRRLPERASESLI